MSVSVPVLTNGGLSGDLADKKRDVQVLSGLSDRFEETMQEKIDRTNAPILAKREQEKAKREQLAERIFEVGIEKYMREQNEIRKLMELMQKMAEKADEDIKENLEHFVEHFEQNPPENVQQMYDYMDSYVMGIQDKELQERLQAMMLKLREMMDDTYKAADDENEDKAPVVVSSQWYL